MASERRAQQRQPMITTERDEVKMAESVDAFEALGHRQQPHPRKKLRRWGTLKTERPSVEAWRLVACLVNVVASRTIRFQLLGHPPALFDYQVFDQTGQPFTGGDGWTVTEYVSGDALINGQVVPINNITTGAGLLNSSGTLNDKIYTYYEGNTGPSARPVLKRSSLPLPARSCRRTVLPKAGSLKQQARTKE